MDTLECLKKFKQNGLYTTSVINVLTSTIARESDYILPTLAGPEIGVASTKAFTSQLVALALVTLNIGRRRHLSVVQGGGIVRALKELPGQVEKELELDSQIRGLAEAYADARNFLYLGRGLQFPVALEGALKLKEVSYIHAEGSVSYTHLTLPTSDLV